MAKFEVYKTCLNYLNVYFLYVDSILKSIIAFAFLLDRTVKDSASCPSMLRRWVLSAVKIKGIVHPKMKILSLNTHPNVTPNP